MGFYCTSLVIIAFMFMMYRVIYLAETHSNKFGRVYGYGLASILFFHVIVNIGMVRPNSRSTQRPSITP